MTTSYGKISAVLLSSAAGLIASAGLASAANITLLNGTTTTAVFPSSASYGTTWAQPVLTTGAQDAAYGADGYVMYATSPSGSSYGGGNGSYYYPGDAKYPTGTPTDPLNVTNEQGFSNGGQIHPTIVNTLSKIPSYLTYSDASYLTSWDAGYGYGNVYARDGSAANTVEYGVASPSNGIAYNTLTKMATMTVGAGAPKNLYIGVLSDQAVDSSSQIQISDGTASVTAMLQNYGSGTPENTSAFPGQNTWYFFDVANAQSGDVITLSMAQYNTGASYAMHPTLAGLTFDSTNPIATPEPASLGLFALGGLGMLLIGRKRAARRTA